MSEFGDELLRKLQGAVDDSIQDGADARRRAADKQDAALIRAGSNDTLLQQTFGAIENHIWRLHGKQHKNGSLRRGLHWVVGMRPLPLEYEAEVPNRLSFAPLDYTISTPPLLERTEIAGELTVRVGWAVAVDGEAPDAVLASARTPETAYLHRPHGSGLRHVQVLRTATDVLSGQAVREPWYDVYTNNGSLTDRRNKPSLEELAYRREEDEMHPAHAERYEEAQLHALGLGRAILPILRRGY